ncbi:hypothetical protein B0H19DRAFT_1075589 [Mycena capillaripes]|nr:hypothetical protein B0H19DRAFT_1075589 [Mycena capillaripes]
MSDDALPHSPSRSRSASRSPSPEPEMKKSPQPSSGRRNRQRQRHAQPQPGSEVRRTPRRAQAPIEQEPSLQLDQQLQRIDQNQALTQQKGQGQMVANPAGQVTSQGAQGRDKKESLKLRLDLNLDVDVQIKARVHGDVTLSLL